MLVRFFFRNQCFKSDFLRTCLKVTDWEVLEIDIDSPGASVELLAIKKLGSGNQVVVPAISTSEVYSHEFYPILEYINDRCPEGMYPVDIPRRLFVRTMLLREVRRIVELWPNYVTSGNPSELLGVYENLTGEMIELINVRHNWRPMEDRPTFIELFFFCLQKEVYKHRPAQTNKQKTIDQWYAQLKTQYEL